ncbi:hypothetical protein FACS1894181_05500 [Bacteroidia bacterium]|nr:hypothetical protein FACS1894181_05500 [Bacteroidia bacterium]
MKQDEITKLLQRYFDANKVGADTYFDADEIDAILDSFEQKEDFSNYEALLNLGLRLHPGNGDLQIRQCKLYLYNEQHQEALDLIDTIAGSNNPEVDMIKLECYCTLNQYPQAAEYMERLIASECEYLEDIFEFLAPILNDLEMTEEANSFIRRGMALFPDNLALKDELCYVLESKDEYEEAIRIYNELIDEDPYSYDYWFNLGRMYSFTNAFSEAIEAFEFAITCFDGSENELDNELKVLRAYCYFMNENYEKAVEAYMEILPVADEATNDRIKSLIAECHSKLEDFEGAYRILHEVINKDTSDAYVYLNYIRCCMETDRAQEASKVLQRAAGLFPDNVRILTLLAISYLENGKDDLAIAMTEQIIRCMEETDMDDMERDDSGSDTSLNEILQTNTHVVSQRPVPLNDLVKEYLSNRKYRN